jgi:hypothetical protein
MDIKRGVLKSRSYLLKFGCDILFGVQMQATFVTVLFNMAKPNIALKY